MGIDGLEHASLSLPYTHITITILVLALAFTRLNAAPFKTISPHDIRRVAGTRRRLESPYESTARGASPAPTTIEVQRSSYVDSGSVKSRSKPLVSMTDLTTVKVIPML
ncbi:hypothetical protein K449DRAFT_390556 [Hypoxylon sp. EC38]|nr:hypothetical protein K449DRAFT_390556 [Hypoxylon sp. EC38]